MSPDDETAGSRNGAAPRRVDPLPRDAKALEALIAQRRADLASTIDELAVRAHPKEIARRSAAGVRDRARAFALTDDGQPRIERLIAVGAAVVSVLGLLIISRSRRSR